jgi:hypothetical protein
MCLIFKTRLSTHAKPEMKIQLISPKTNSKSGVIIKSNFNHLIKILSPVYIYSYFRLILNLLN